MESATGAAAMVTSEEVQEHDTADLRLDDLLEKSDLYHLLGIGNEDTTIGSFVPSNLFSRSECCPTLSGVGMGI